MAEGERKPYRKRACRQNPKERMLPASVVNEEFAKHFAESGDATKASELTFGAGILEHKFKGCRMMKRPEVRALVLVELERRKATPIEAANVFADEMAAERVKIDRFGDRRVVGPDYATRHRGAKAVMDLWGQGPGRQEGGKGQEKKDMVDEYLSLPLAVRMFIAEHRRMPTRAERDKLEGIVTVKAEASK